MRQRQRLHLLGLLAAAPLLAGCGWGGEEEPEPAPTAPVPVSDSPRLVASIIDMELGRLRDGYALSVFGLAETTGWSAPDLRLRDERPDADGFLNLDFVATPPATPSASPMAALPAARRVRADEFFSETLLASITGLRIWSEAGPSEVTFN